MENNLQEINIDDWVLKVRQPQGPGPHPVIIMNHGWTGDENSMWVFAAKLPTNALVIAPRAPHLSTHPEYGGYSWINHKSGDWPWLDDFRPPVAALAQLISRLPAHLPADYTKFSLVGFSQGAALSYVFALLHPRRIDRLAGLAGFLPERSDSAIASQPLRGLPVFVAHGAYDKIVPLPLARQAVASLTQAGANLTFCQGEVGHKLGANCFSALQSFFA